MTYKKIPKDLKPVITSQLGSTWSKVRDNLKREIQDMETSVMISKEFLAVATKKAEVEAKKFNNPIVG